MTASERRSPELAPVPVQQCSIRIDKEDIKFSAGHFTLFADGARERLHGHNFNVAAVITTRVENNGMTLDYNIIKRALRALCQELDEYVLIPTLVPSLTISTLGRSLVIVFGEDEFRLPAGDVRLLPIRNTTVEELAAYLLNRLVGQEAWSARWGVTEIALEVSSGPGQSAQCRWRDVGA
ncbi:MAG: 6-carboxytetrahydropterin synthase [Brevundimonas sp.]|uniref:6-pyruvoyl trahydropterin synthase family protein n=1 Tax=Brevundimonas sp. TaxID=1871086 RepID=UPI002489F507|nr:6-carboxytetrahydropterin synthase [Brevundimonas sp.]MDI1328519.1 6-carboxytetrahydropterin synthase [Brevundimonas sp.]